MARVARSQSGERRTLSKITTVQRGDTLVIDMADNTRINGSTNDLRADLTVPNLQEFVSQGVGSSELSGFSGNRVTLSLAGAGAVAGIFGMSEVALALSFSEPRFWLVTGAIVAMMVTAYVYFKRNGWF